MNFFSCFRNDAVNTTAYTYTNTTGTSAAKNTKKVSFTIRCSDANNLMECDFEKFFIESVDSIKITERICGSDNPSILNGQENVIVIKQTLRFPNERSHAFILFIMDRREVGNMEDYIGNKRKSDYYVLKYIECKYELIYVNGLRNEMNVTSDTYISNHPIVKKDDMVIGCINEVPLFYFKNNGKIEVTLNVRRV
jgi:hypothetical protein